MNPIIKACATSVTAFVRKNSTTILTSIGVAGVFGTAALTAKATANAKDVIAKKKLQKKDVLKETWKYYIPPALSAVATSACIIGSHSLDKKQIASLAATCAMSEGTIKRLDLFKQKAGDILGEAKTKEIEESVKKEVAVKPINDNTVIFTGYGTQLCYDEGTCQYFYSNEKMISQQVNDLNKRLRRDNEIYVTEYCGELGIETPQFAENQVWSINKNDIVIKTYYKKLPDGSPCLCIKHEHLPIDTHLVY